MKLKCLKNKYTSSLIASLAIYFTLSFILPINNFAVYITSYINIKQHFVTMHYGLFINLIFGFANTFSSSLGGFLENYIGFLYTVIVGIIIVFITNLVFIFQQNIWLCYVLCIFFGIGTGISVSLLGKNLILYVPEKKGIVSGIIGLATIIFCALFAIGGEKLINPKGEGVNDDDLYREGIANKTYIYFLIGECFIPVGLIIFLLFIHEYKKEDNSEDNSTQAIKEENNDKVNEVENNDKVNEVENNDKVNEVENKEEEKKEDNPNKEGKLNLEITKKKVKQVIKTCRFWKITLISFLINFGISFMINTGRTFGAIIGINGNALQFAGMFQLLAVIAMVPTLGKGVDKKGPLPFLRIISIVCIIPGILLAFLMENTYVFISAFIIFVIGITGLMMTLIPFIMEVYGIQESVILGGFISGFTKISDIIATVVPFLFSIFCKDDDNKDMEEDCLKKNYAIMYIISSISCGISTLLLFFETNDKYIYKEVKSEEPLLNEENEDIIIMPPDNNFTEENQITDSKNE